jgi:hypothetical protein
LSAENSLCHQSAPQSHKLRMPTVTLRDQEISMSRFIHEPCVEFSPISFLADKSGSANGIPLHTALNFLVCISCQLTSRVSPYKYLLPCLRPQPHRYVTTSSCWALDYRSHHQTCTAMICALVTYQVFSYLQITSTQPIGYGCDASVPSVLFAWWLS